jgi:hypothetical protein
MMANNSLISAGITTPISHFVSMVHRQNLYRYVRLDTAVRESKKLTMKSSSVRIRHHIHDLVASCYMKALRSFQTMAIYDALSIVMPARWKWPSALSFWLQRDEDISGEMHETLASVPF